MAQLIRLGLALACMLAASTLVACNTTAGAGQDISNTGQAISNGAQKLTP